MNKLVLLGLATACAIIAMLANEANAAPTAGDDATLASLAEAIAQLSNSLKEAGQTQIAEHVAAAAELAATGDLPEDINESLPGDIRSKNAFQKRVFKFENLSPDDQAIMAKLAKAVKHMAATIVDKEVAEKLNI